MRKIRVTVGAIATVGAVFAIIIGANVGQPACAIVVVALLAAVEVMAAAVGSVILRLRTRDLIGIAQVKTEFNGLQNIATAMFVGPMIALALVSLVFAATLVAGTI